jgi:hypothetical protein
MATATSQKRRGNTRKMSSDHKAALALGREQGRVVRRYLEALDTTKPPRGRRRTPASIAKRLAAIKTELPDAGSLQRLHLLQEQRDLQAVQAKVEETVDLGALEKEFVKAAAAYGERKGLSYATWRAAGVPAAVLDKAGIARTRL